MRQAQAVSQAIGQQIVLADLEGRQLMNTRLPLGTALPGMQSIATVRQAIASRMPAVSGLFKGGATGAPTVALMVPVLRDDRPHSVLAVSVRPTYLSSLLTKQGLPDGWLVSVIDANNLLIARSVDGERLVGRPATADFRNRERGDGAVWLGTTQEGTPVLAATQWLRNADWRVSISVPISLVEEPLRYTVVLLVITGAVTLGVAVLLATQLASSVSVPLRRLARAGGCFGERAAG